MAHHVQAPLPPVNYVYATVVNSIDAANQGKDIGDGIFQSSGKWCDKTDEIACTFPDKSIR
jgi:hypothetical protein